MYKKSLKITKIDDPTTGKLSFGLENGNFQQSTGFDLLTDQIIIRLFTKKGSNAFQEDVGSGLYDLLGRGYNPTKIDLIKSEFINIFSDVENQIKTEQLTEDLLPTEILSSIEIKKIEYNQATTSWEILVLVSTEAGLTKEITLG